MRSSLNVERVATPASRALALSVIDAVYLNEKRWIHDVGAEIAEDAASRPRESWFVASLGEEAVGAIRLVYDPSLEMPAEYGVAIEPHVDLEGLKRRGRFVDIGRFMIVPSHRHNVRVALGLMRAAIGEVVERGYTHFLTDVFESDPHSPLQFHTRVLGFERIGTHRTGELACESVRIILILDIARAYLRHKRRQNRIWKELGAGLADSIEGRLARSA